MNQLNEVSEALKPWEIQDSSARRTVVAKLVLLSLLLSLASFTLGLFAYLAEYAMTGRSDSLSIMAGSISNLAWGVIFLLSVRWFTPEPYLRIAFYSFVAPTLYFAVDLIVSSELGPL